MKKLLCLLPALLFSASAHSQPERFSLYLEGSNLNAAEQQGIRQRLLGRLRSRGNERHELFDLSGPLVTNTVCPIGYVRRANYDISIDEADVVREEGADCDAPGQCRAWQVEIAPEDDQQLYDFSIQLQCSADDTLPDRNSSEIRSERASAVLRGARE